MNFLALTFFFNTETGLDIKNAYGNSVQVVLEGFEILPESVDAFDWYLHDAVIDFAERVHLLLSFPSGAFLDDMLVYGACGFSFQTRDDDHSLKLRFKIMPFPHIYVDMDKAIARCGKGATYLSRLEELDKVGPDVDAVLVLAYAVESEFIGLFDDITRGGSGVDAADIGHVESPEVDGDGRLEETLEEGFCEMERAWAEEVVEIRDLGCRLENKGLACAWSGRGWLTVFG